MAVMGISCGGKNTVSFFDPSLIRSNHVSRSNCFVSIPNSGIRNPFSLRISASMAVSDFPSCTSWINGSGHGLIEREETEVSREKEPKYSDNLDVWVRDSVVEIVKNLKKAPLLVHIYCNSSGSMELKTENGCAEDWPNMEKEWREGSRKSPDGIILVEEIEDEDLETEEEESGTKAWGVLIQGKGVERGCRPSCYLLKTCSVNSGLGMFGTHFSLVKVKNFRETAFSQLKNSWLLP